MPSVLIVESDDRLLAERAEQLLMDGYAVDAVSTFEAARIKLVELPEMLVLCNLGTGPDTIGLLRQLRAGEFARADHDVPVLVVGADDDSAAVRYYSAGADLALPSRSSPLLVAAGLDSLARRTDPEQRHQILRVGTLRLDCQAHTCEVGGRDVRLSRLEFDLLRTLASEPRKTFPRAELIRQIWGYEPNLLGTSRPVAALQYRLKQKLERADAPQLVQSVHGVGLRLTQ
jgi:two-component system response regulator MtrA